jgi:hypothetical protein
MGYPWLLIIKWHENYKQIYIFLSTKDKNKTKDRVTRTLLKTWVNSGAPEGLSSSCSTSHTRRVNIATNPAYGVYISMLIRYTELVVPIRISLIGVADNKEATEQTVPLS